MAEFNITAVCIVSDPKEIQRQWGQVYRLLMEVPRRDRDPEDEGLADATQPSVEMIPAVEEE